MSDDAARPDEPNPDDMGDGDEVLLRQVVELHLDDGEPSSSAFVPRDVDDGLLSVDRSSITDAEASQALFNAPKPAGFSGKSAEVWGVSVGECRASSVTPSPNPLAATSDTPPNPAHALVDFTGLASKSQRQKVGKVLKRAAMARKRLHPK